VEGTPRPAQLPEPIGIAPDPDLNSGQTGIVVCWRILQACAKDKTGKGKTKGGEKKKKGEIRGSPPLHQNTTW
jgi:hypothetical protein